MKRPTQKSSGKYKLTVHAFYRAGSYEEEEANINNGVDTHLAKFYANTSVDLFEKPVMNLSAGGVKSEAEVPEGAKTRTINGIYVPDGTSASVAFYNAGYYLNELEFFVGEDGTVSAVKKEYVDKAHDVIAGLGTYKVITKTKIRSIYNMLCDIIDDEKHSSDAEISNESQMALRMFKVRVIYDCGRDDSVKAFVKRSHIIGYMLDIGSSRDKFDIYCKYFESLIAYHRFLYGDKD